MAQSGEYWRKRLKVLENREYMQTSAYYEDLKKQFAIAERNLQSDISYWYQRLARNNNISLAAAKELLKKNELEEFHWTVEGYIKRGKENELNARWMKKLENASARVHISHLEAMKLQVQQHAEELYQHYETGTANHLKAIYKDGYYHNAYEIAKGTGVGSSFSAIDTRKIDKVIATPWARDGKVFSDRIWENKDKLVAELHTELTQCIIRGENPDEAAKRLAEKMGGKLGAAQNLVYTESAAISACAQRDCYGDLAVEQFEVVETLDSHTCPTCRDMDGKHFPMEDYKIGVTAPPFHPRCRGCTCPYFGDEFDSIGERAARGEDGRTYYVPADMTYREWEKTFVESAHTEDTKSEVNYLIRNHVAGQNTMREQQIVREAVADVPLKVQQAMENTIIDIGKTGASQYDYKHDIIYVAERAQKEDIIHEIGHMVENKMLDGEKVIKLRKQIVKNISPNDIIKTIMYDAAGQEHEVFLVKSNYFLSEYQGRIYVNDWDEIYDENWNIRDDRLLEFVSEIFREYIENPQRIEKEYPEFYKLIKEVAE